MEDFNLQQPAPADLGSPHVVCLAGELNLSSAEQVRQTLVDSLQSGEPLTLDLATLTDIDLAGLQLLCSAHLSYARRNIALVLREVPPWFPETAKTCGFQRHPLFRGGLSTGADEGALDVIREGHHG